MTDTLDDIDRLLIDRLQDGLAIVPRPFAMLADEFAADWRACFTSAPDWEAQAPGQTVARGDTSASSEPTRAPGRSTQHSAR